MRKSWIEVSAGDADYKDVLARFWRDFSAAIAETTELRITEVLDVLDAALAPTLYPPREDGTDPRVCPLCGEWQLHLKTSRTGGFVGCGNYPECRYTRPIGGDAQESAERVLGEDAGDEICLRTGPLRPLCAARRGDRGEQEADTRQPAQRVASRRNGPGKGADAAVSLPREIGDHPDGGMITPISAASAPI